MSEVWKNIGNISQGIARNAFATVVYTGFSAFFVNTLSFNADEERQLLMSDFTTPNEDILYHTETFDGIDLTQPDDLLVAVIGGLVLRFVRHITNGKRT